MIRSVLVAIGLAIGVVSGLAFALGAGAAAAQALAKAPPQTGCTQPLDACTKARAAALKALARKFTAASRMKPATTLTAEERARVQVYDRWLRAHSQQARELAERAGAATTAEIQTAFDREFVQFRERIQREHRQFEQISPMMKAKHDAASEAIGNLR